jgi:acyl carrier protein
MTTHDRLEKIFQNAFGIKTLTDEMSIDTVQGWDSMAHVALIMALQQEFSVSISPAQAIELTDVASIKKYIQ